MSTLTSDQVALQLENFLPDWQAEGNSLIKTYQFDDFASAISFMTHVAFYAEALEHYPTWQNLYNVISVRIGDPAQGEMRSRDVQLARRMESVYARFACVDKSAE